MIDFLLLLYGLNCSQARIFRRGSSAFKYCDGGIDICVKETTAFSFELTQQSTDVTQFILQQTNSLCWRLNQASRIVCTSYTTLVIANLGGQGTLEGFTDSDL